MYKLVAVGGKIRGQEIVLNEGENILGRASECNHVISVDGVSKKHMRITVNGDTAFVEDLGSSNGTFVNGKLIKRMTVNSGDKIALPNIIYQVVFVKEKKVIVKKVVTKVKESESENSDLDVLDNEPMPADGIGKLKHTFKHKVMGFLYSFNEEYEWHGMMAVLIGLFIVVNITLTIFPILRDSRQILLFELAKRGVHYTEDIARLNARALERKDIDKLDTVFLDNEDGVTSYELYDMEGRIVRPIGKLNQFISDTFSVYAKNKIIASLQGGKSKGEDTIKEFLDDGEVGIARAIKTYNVRTGIEEPVGIIAIRFAPKSLVMEAANNLKAYMESVITSGLVGILFFAILYYLTLRPIDEFRIQMEMALRGKIKEVDIKKKMQELSSLKGSVNSLIQRVRELQTDGQADSANLEDDGPYITQLKEFMRGAQGPIIILNSEKVIQDMNPECEDLLGIRANASTGTGLLDSARDQGFAATVIDLCDKSASNGGVNQKEGYELQGKNHLVNVVALMGKDSFAKGFYITFVKD
jgi:pSer/pThr/pTyr-binding forkhead associated (FHA) protein/PAS domain-containing protein